MSSFPLGYLRTFCPRKSKPCSTCVITVFVGEKFKTSFLQELLAHQIRQALHPKGLFCHQIEVMGTCTRKRPVYGTGTVHVGNDEVRATAVRGSNCALSLLQGQVLDALQMILIGASLKEVLTSLTRLIQAHSEGMLCSIFLLDEDGLHLQYGAAANLPEAYRAATDGVRIGPNVGSCGAAAYLRKPVFVSDILSHPNFASLRSVVLQSGLRAAWSTPVMSKDGKVLGTFCMYYREVRHPGADDIQLIDYASRVAGIAIERERSRSAMTTAFEQIKKSEAELRTIIDAIPQLIIAIGTDGKFLYANQALLEYTGLTKEEVRSESFGGVLHPGDSERLRDECDAALSRGVPFEYERRVRRKGGQYRWQLIHYKPLRDEAGNVIRWYATGTDIEDQEIDRFSMYESIVGSSEALRGVLSQISKVAPTDATVLISGETGTGKELIASAIHKRSKRSARAFIRVNCAAIPPSLIASELFGYEKGAFTGAIQRRAGRFESADGGTIFLDEIGELSPEVQIALLRVLQEREFERVGSSQPISIDVRVLAATNRDLEAAVGAGTFRQDLFYRLNVFPIRAPSLRERKDDIPLLVEYLVERYAKRAGKRISHIEKKTLGLFQAYDWPGNIRELQNVIERAVILCDGETFSVDETWLPRKSSQLSGRQVSRAGVLADDKKEFAERERKAIESALTECQGRVSGPHGAAAKLGIPHQTLASKMASLGIDKRRFKVHRSKPAFA
jgi:formate hydrogenlyase transcriptional activator